MGVDARAGRTRARLWRAVLRHVKSANHRRRHLAVGIRLLRTRGRRGGGMDNRGTLLITRLTIRRGAAAPGQRHGGQGHAEHAHSEHDESPKGATITNPFAPRNGLASSLWRRKIGRTSLPGLRRARGRQRTLHAIRVSTINSRLTQGLLAMITAEKAGEMTSFHT